MTPNSIAVEEPVPPKEYKRQEYKKSIIWFNVMILLYLHVLCLYAVYLCFTAAYLKTTLFALMVTYLGGLGVSAGVHRLWTHKSYKAKLPLRVLLCCFFSIASQKDIYNWCRDHRVHHKFSETDADPHNIKRGFFFAHVGWLMCKKHPDVAAKGNSILLDDLLTDPVVRFHIRFYYPMVLFFSGIIPVVIPVWCWNETLCNSFFIAGIAKSCIIHNFTWLVNSAAHKYGNKPYDKELTATENVVVALLSVGEGWHDYHHAFPWDYSASELGNTLNLSKIFIDFMALIGQAYDLKLAHHNMVNKKKLKAGDGTRLKQVCKQK